MSNIIKQSKPKPQAKRIDPKLKSKILSKILLPDASISKIAKEYNLSSTTLYGWRIDHIKKLTFDLKNNQELSKASENNFIELVSGDSLGQEEGLLSTKISSPLSATKNSNSKLSEISLIFNNNISLSLKGNINSSSLIKIINCLEEESC
jgi:transposase-like protein